MVIKKCVSLGLLKVEKSSVQFSVQIGQIFMLEATFPKSSFAQFCRLTFDLLKVCLQSLFFRQMLMCAQLSFSVLPLRKKSSVTSDRKCIVIINIGSTFPVGLQVQRQSNKSIW